MMMYNPPAPPPPSPVYGGAGATTFFSAEEDNDMEEEEVEVDEDLAAMDDLTTDSASVVVVERQPSSSTLSKPPPLPLPRHSVTTGVIFNRNKYVLASVLSSDIKRLVTKVVWRQEGYSRWNRTFSGPLVRANALSSLMKEPRPELFIAKTIMDRVEEADCYDQFMAKLIRSGAMSGRLKKKVVDICRNKYSPPVPRFMIQLVRNRKVADQEKLLKALDVGPYYDDEYHIDDDDDEDDLEGDDDFEAGMMMAAKKYLRDDAKLECGLSRWILKKQRSKDYNAHCDTQGQDSNALADFEQGITKTAKMPLLNLSPNVVRAIHDTCDRTKLLQLVRKMRRDLGGGGAVSAEEEEEDKKILFLDNTSGSRRRLGGLIADWLLARQRRGLISNHLKSDIMCYIYALELDKPLGLASSSPGDDNDDEERWMGGGEPPNWRFHWEDLDYRVQSFGKEWARRHNQSALSMAQSGFRLMSLRPETNPSKDVVTCYQCWISLRKWQDDDDPDLEHLWRTCEERRRCPYLLSKLGRPMVNFIEGLQKVGDPKPRDMNHARNLYGAQQF